MEKEYLNLMQIFNGYVRNYRRMNLSQIHNRSMFTQREIEFFANLGEMLGYDAFVEDTKHDKLKGRSRPMDLALWKWDQRIDIENYVCLVLHLERENQWNKDEETIEKLFSETDEGFTPHNVIGIQYVESRERMDFLNSLVLEKNAIQKSNVLMVYRYFDKLIKLEKVSAFYFSPTNLMEVRNAICKQDELGYWFMCFEEEQNSPFNVVEGDNDFEQHLVSFLKENRITSVNQFNQYYINHVKPESDLDRKNVNSGIKKEFKGYRGVYIYLNESNNVLYVGIGKLAERVRFHYYESFGKYSGKNCEKHIKFFTQYPGRIKVLWTVIEDRVEQKRVEDMLTQHLKPIYESMKKEGLLY